MQLKTIDVHCEVVKVAEVVGNSMIISYLNSSRIDWFEYITEYIVYATKSIGSFAGCIFYWNTIQHFFQEDGINQSKSKKLFRFMDENLVFITNHKYYNEVMAFKNAFPFELLKADVIDISETIAKLILYPDGKLNRFVAIHFPKLPKTLSRNIFEKQFRNLAKSELLNFDIEKLWNEGGTDEIKSFLKVGILHRNKLANYSLLFDSPPDYLDTIKKWIENQMSVLKGLNEIEKLEINRPQEGEADLKIQAKYYALYHLILVELKEEKDFPRDESDRYNRKDIETFAAEKYPHISAQSFYRAYLNNDISDKEAIISDNKDFIEKLSLIAKNKPKVLRYIRRFPG